MAKFFKVKISVIGIIVFFGIILIFISCYFSVTEHGKRSLGGISNKLNFGVEDFVFTEYKDMSDGTEEKKFTIQGKRLGIESKKLGFFRVALAKAICIKDAEVTFYENNMPVSTLWAEEAVSDIPFDADGISAALTRRIDFSGGIILMTEDKRTLTCDKLRWDKEEDCLFASGNCVLGYEGRRVRADLIKTDPTLRIFDISKDTRKRLTKIPELFKRRIQK